MSENEAGELVAPRLDIPKKEMVAAFYPAFSFDMDMS
jgi:hypothetical protein